MRFPNRLDLAFFEQITAESLITRQMRSGYEVREWIKTRARNEQFDLGVYARALARHDTAGFTDQGWDRLAARRRGGSDEPDLIALMQGGIAVEASQDVTPAEPERVVDDAPRPPPLPRKASWIGPRRGWL